MTTTQRNILTLILFIIAIILISKAMYGFGTTKGRKFGADFVCKTIKEGDSVSELTKCACSPDCCVDENNQIVTCN